MMMMAHDPSPPPGALSAESVRILRDALDEFMEAPDTQDPTSLRSALETLADEARTKAIVPEQLLITLKDVWYALPSVRELKDPDEQVRILQRVVTMCIKEYYR